MINIGVITAKSSLDSLKPIFRMFEDQCHYHFLPYEKIEEIHQIFCDNNNIFDGFIFGGPLSYYSLEQDIKNWSKPVVYLDITEKDFYKHLFKVSQLYKGIDFSRVYFDFFWDEKNVLQLEHLLGDQKPFYTLSNEIDFQNMQLYEESLDKHLYFWKEGLIDLSITRAANLVGPLKSHGLNVYYMGISEDTIKEKIEELIMAIEYARLKENQVVAGYIESPTSSNMIENDLMQLSIHKELLEFCAQEGFQLGIQKYNHTFEIITSYGDLQEMTNNFRSCKIIRFLKERLSFNVHIGWGIGITLGQALQNARNAYRQAESYTESCTFVIDEGKQSMGPFGFEEANDEENAFNSWEEIEALGQSLDVSTSLLQKVIFAMSRLKTNELTSNLTAEVLNVSVRSANRILNQLVEKNLAKVEQKKHNSLQGRPIKTYIIQLPITHGLQSNSKEE